MIKRIIALFFSTVIVLFAGQGISAKSAENGSLSNIKNGEYIKNTGSFTVKAENEVQEIVITEQKSSFELEPTCFDLGGGSAAVSFNYPGTKYSCKIYYTKDNVTYMMKPQANGFAYIQGLKNGEKYSAEVICEYDGKKLAEEFTIDLSGKDNSIVSMVQSTESALSLAWNDFAPSQTYIVFRKQNGKWMKVTETKRTDFTDSQLKSGVSYNYLIAVKGTEKIIAVNETESCYYTVYNCNYKVVADFSNGFLSWNNVENADGYYIYQKTEDGFKKVNEIKQATSLKIEKGKRYYYAVAPFFRNSDDSVTVGKMTEAVRVPKNGLLHTKLYYDTTVMSLDSWGSEKVCSITKGSEVYVGELIGNFYHCIIDDKSGYIYKRAITGETAPSNMLITNQNLDLYLDDILFGIGTSPAAIWTYVNSMGYSVARSDSRITDLNSIVSCRNSLSVNMIKYQAGICYHYAALSAKLLSRAGYQVKIVYCPHTGGGFHCYNVVLINGQWKYFDACRHADNNELGYFPDREEFLNYRNLDASNEQVSGVIA